MITQGENYKLCNVLKQGDSSSFRVRTADDRHGIIQGRSITEICCFVDEKMIIRGEN